MNDDRDTAVTPKDEGAGSQPVQTEALDSGDSSFKSKVLKSFLWLATGTFLGQLISWLSTLIVIRLLVPSDYGLMAMTGSLIMLLTMISELGISAAIIQAPEIEAGEISPQAPSHPASLAIIHQKALPLRSQLRDLE